MGIRNLIGSVGSFLSGLQSNKEELAKQTLETEFRNRTQAVRSRFALARLRHHA